MDLCLKRPWCSRRWPKKGGRWSNSKERRRWTPFPLVSTSIGKDNCYYFWKSPEWFLLLGGTLSTYLPVFTQDRSHAWYGGKKSRFQFERYWSGTKQRAGVETAHHGWSQRWVRFFFWLIYPWFRHSSLIPYSTIISFIFHYNNFICFTQPRTVKRRRSPSSNNVSRSPFSSWRRNCSRPSTIIKFSSSSERQVLLSP